jgi:CheY-like chemotaxis protein
MRIPFTLFIFLLSSLSVFSQTVKIDSIENSMVGLKGASRARYMLAATERLLRDSSKESMELALNTDKLTKALDNWKMKVRASDNLGQAYLQINDYQAALQAFNEGLKVRLEHHDTVGAAYSKSKLGNALLLLGDFDGATDQLNAALADFQKFNDTLGIAAVQRLLGDLSLALGDQSAAFAHLNSAIDLYSKQAADEINHIKLLEIQNIHHKRVRGLLFLLIGLTGFLAAMVSIFYRKKQQDNLELSNQIAENNLQKAEIEVLNKEQEMKNISLELLNKKLVDEMAERESMQRSSFARDRFLAAISHEMRTPLNDITGLTHLLLDNNPRIDQIEQLRTLQFSANELVVFINEALGFSKIEVGKLDLQNREFDFAGITGNIFSSIAKKAEDKGLLFHCAVDHQIPRRLLGNESRFYQILSNLLNNCIDSTNEGVVRIALLLEEQNEKMVVLRIVAEASDGGMERNLHSNRYEPLSDDEPVFGSADGRQLSLAMTKRLVEHQHGRIQVENVFDEATRFTVLLPFKVTTSQFGHVASSGPSNYAELQGAQILLVEDNKINQVIVAKMLRRYGMTVVTADNGYEALEQLELQAFNLVLMDIQMPEMDGYRTTAEIRKHPTAEINSLPIVALTSSAFLTEKEKALLFGMNDHVGKPFSPDELLEKISACIELKRDFKI